MPAKSGSSFDQDRQAFLRTLQFILDTMLLKEMEHNCHTAETDRQVQLIGQSVERIQTLLCYFGHP